jgi:hypothetical protein
MADLPRTPVAPVNRILIVISFVVEMTRRRKDL